MTSRPPTGPVPDRVVDVDRERLPGWVGGFVERHGLGEWRPVVDGVEVVGADGAVARLVEPLPGAFAGVSSVRTLVGRPTASTCAIVLVRRGGYAVGVAREGALLASKTGTRYVQGRTAAGGWSQQRYQRRRGNQADALAGAVADLVATMCVHRADIERLAVGGDRGLVAQVLSDPRLASLAALPRLELDDVPDPRRAVLESAARRVDAVRVAVIDPKENVVPTSRELLPVATDQVLALVRAFPAQAWDRTSPCEGWTARDVLRHLTSEALWAPHLLRGEKVAEVGDRYDGDVLGDDPVAAYERAAAAEVVAFTESMSSPLTDTVDTSAGPLTIREYAKQRLVDVVVHGWDLAKAASMPYEPNPQAVDKALAYMGPHVEPGGMDGLFDSPVSTDSRSRLDQLVALLGRDPNWRD